MGKMRILVLSQALALRLAGLGHHVVDASAPIRANEALEVSAEIAKRNKGAKPDFKLASAKNCKTAHWANRIPHGQLAAKAHHRQRLNRR